MKNYLKDLKRKDHKRYLGGLDIFRYIGPGLLQQELKTYRPETGANVKTTGCQQTATDQPSAYFVWIRPDGTTTKLSHYTGCISPANIELNKLIDKLPKLIGIEDLVR